MLIGLSGTFFACVASEEYFEPVRGKTEFNVEDTTVSVLRSLVTLSTLSLLFLIWRHHILYLRIQKVREVIDPGGKYSAVHNLFMFSPLFPFVIRNALDVRELQSDADRNVLLSDSLAPVPERIH